MALKVGIVGLNSIGNKHAECHTQDELSELVAVCDVVRKRADDAAEKYGAKAYYDLKEMLKNEELDIVDVCTGGLENGSWHFEPVMSAIDMGKHVLVEKPISNDINEARQMVDAASKKGVYLGCNLNHYFTPTADRAMEYMKNGRIGETVYCLHKMGFNGGEFGYNRSRSGKVDGFPYFHIKAFLAHPFSLMRYFCGDITHVQAFASQPGFRKSAGDVMLSINSIHVRFQSGAVGYLLSQRGDAQFGLGGWWSFETGGTKGAFCIENCIEKLYFWVGDRPGETMGQKERIPEVLDTGIKDFGETFPRRIHAFLEDVDNKVYTEDVRASGRDALATLEYTWAVMESCENAGAIVRPAKLPPLKGDPNAFVG